MERACKNRISYAILSFNLGFNANSLFWVRERLPYLYVLKGKLAFLRSVRTFRDPVFIKLATQFNNLVDDDTHKFKIVTISDPEQSAIDSLWVVEACYDENGNVKSTQGTGFQLDNKKTITCAHVVYDKDGLFKKLEVYKHSDTTKTFSIQVDKI